MRYSTKKNLMEAVQLIMDKGFDRETAVAITPKFFRMVKPDTPPVEHFISLLEPPKKKPQ